MREAKRIRRGKGKRDKNIYKLLQKLVEMHSVASLGSERVNASVPCPGCAICSVTAERPRAAHAQTRVTSNLRHAPAAQQLSPVLSSTGQTEAGATAASQHLAPTPERWTCSGRATSGCPHTPNYPAALISMTSSCCCQHEYLHCKFVSAQIIEQIYLPVCQKLSKMFLNGPPR